MENQANVARIDWAKAASGFKDHSSQLNDPRAALHPPSDHLKERRNSIASLSDAPSFSPPLSPLLSIVPSTPPPPPSPCELDTPQNSQRLSTTCSLSPLPTTTTQGPIPTRSTPLSPMEPDVKVEPTLFPPFKSWYPRVDWPVQSKR
eukprot:TRINITY_DN15346_c0_g1_i1.p1 TRINITY_DN15346_c0_g1~~TRINITY_DN15346_c0_g1_i1.p1  ORF type:complete len:165 (-),score=21.11 TRINITY_DN15346_c0_g1_i1:2-442(-)